MREQAKKLGYEAAMNEKVRVPMFHIPKEMWNIECMAAFLEGYDTKICEELMKI